MLFKNIFSDDNVTVKYLFYFFKICGVATMSLKTDSINCNNKKSYIINFTTSKIGIVYNILFIFLLTTLKYFTIKILIETDYGGKIKFEKVINTIHDGFTLFASAYILIVFSIRQKRAISLVNDLKLVWQSKSVLNTKQMENKNHTLINAVKNIFLVNSFTWFLFLITSVVGDWDLFVYNISSYLSSMIINSIFMQYSIILNLIQKIFISINESLLRLLNSSSSVIEVSSIHSKNSQCNVNKLLFLKNLHSSVFKLSRDLSDFYSHLMVLCILYVFLTFVLFGYYVLVPIVKGRYPISLGDSVHCLFIIFMYAVSLKVLTSIATATVESVGIVKNNLFP